MSMNVHFDQLIGNYFFNFLILLFCTHKHKDKSLHEAEAESYHQQ